MASNPRSAPTNDSYGAPRSPAARRLQSVRWLNPRLVLGVVLVLAAVVAGARIVGASDDSVTVWAATDDLAAGVQLTEADLNKVEVQLEGGTSKYLSASDLPAGAVLVRDVAEGELIPAAAIADSSDVVSLALSIPAQQLPISAARGDRVSIYASDSSASAASTSDPASAASGTVLVAEAVTIADVSGRSDGALSVGAADLQVVVAVPQCAVQPILDATNGKVLTAVVLEASSTVPELC